MWPAQFDRKLVLGTRRNWPRPRRDRDVDNFSRDETDTRRWYVSRPSRDRDVETETTTLPTARLTATNYSERSVAEQLSAEILKHYWRNWISIANIIRQ